MFIWKQSVIRLSSVYICAWFVELHECKHIIVNTLCRLQGTRGPNTGSLAPGGGQRVKKKKKKKGRISSYFQIAIPGRIIRRSLVHYALFFLLICLNHNHFYQFVISCLYFNCTALHIVVTEEFTVYSSVQQVLLSMRRSNS